MPVGLFALTMQLDTGSITVPGGVSFPLDAAAGMVTWGAAVAGFVNMPEVVARARDNGVLKRLQGSPLRPGAYLAGQTLSAVCSALLSAAIVLSVGVVVFGLRIAWPLVPAATALLVLGTATFGACGLALAATVRSSKGVTAGGLGILLSGGLLLGHVFPISELPAWIGTVGSLLPMKHLADGLVMMLDPAGAGVGWGGIAVLIAWFAGAAVIALRGFARVGGRPSWDPARGRAERPRARAARRKRHRARRAIAPWPEGSFRWRRP